MRRNRLGSDVINPLFVNMHLVLQRISIHDLPKHILLNGDSLDVVFPASPGRGRSTISLPAGLNSHGGTGHSTPAELTEVLALGGRFSDALLGRRRRSLGFGGEEGAGRRG